jgi:membrane-associated protein
MEHLLQFVDIFLHLDKHLGDWIQTYHAWIYLILFLIIFCETGLVVTPFLPGDSLLFMAGFLGASGRLEVGLVCLLLGAAAILGDTVNYWIGKIVGPKVFHKENVRLLNKKHLLRAHDFYVKYGGVTIIIARFMPIIRTFAPFVAGIGSMTYWKFLTYNVVGGAAWVLLLVFFGYFCGMYIPWVKDHLSVVTAVIVLISIMPMAVAYLRRKKSPQEQSSTQG